MPKRSQRHLNTPQMMCFAPLPRLNYSVCNLGACARNSGADAKALLQGLMTNDMSLLDEGEGRRPCISAAFLNPKVCAKQPSLLRRLRMSEGADVWCAPLARPRKRDVERGGGGFFSCSRLWCSLCNFLLVRARVREGSHQAFHRGA